MKIPTTSSEFLRPLAKVALLWMTQAGLFLGYLRYASGHGGLGLLMHLIILATLSLLCVAPFTFQNTSRTPDQLKRQRVALASLFASVHALLLLLYGLLLIAFQTWGRMPDIEAARVCLRQSTLALMLMGISRATFLCALIIVWTVLLLLYRPVSYKLIQAIHNPDTPVEMNSKGIWKPVAIRPFLAAALGSILFTYLCTQMLWRTGEPIHLLAHTDPENYVHMVPANVFRVHTTQTHQNAFPKNSPPITPRNLVLITVDALRSDQMEVYGGPPDTPYLSTLLHEGKLRRMDSAYSICTFSFCGLLGLHSSAYWHQLNATPLVLADVLSHYGYQTHFLLSGDHTHFFGLRKFYGTHLDEYRDGSQMSMEQVNDDRIVLPWLRGIRWSAQHPTFVDIHLMSAHFLSVRRPEFERWRPHQIATAHWGTGTPIASMYRNNYLDGILQADDMIREIFAILAQQGVLAESLVIISADHAESLGEHGHFGHGHEPFEPEVRIPLLIYDESAAVYPERELTSQVDIAPTFLRAIAAPIPASWVGIPLQEKSSRNAVSVASYETSGIVAQLGKARYKYLRARKDGSEQLFALGASATEEHNLAKDVDATSVLQQMRLLFLKSGAQRDADARPKP